ncbi:MAG: hypothetical protein Q9204_003195 [Flavoplaca sp. TL-2023a]
MATNGITNGSSSDNSAKNIEQVNSNPANGPVLTMSSRTVELEARYQQLLLQKIAVLEKELGPRELVKETVVAGAPFEKHEESLNDEQSSGDTTKKVDDNLDAKKDERRPCGQKIIKRYEEDEDGDYRWVEKPFEIKDDHIEDERAPIAEYAFTFYEYYKKAGPRAYDYSLVTISSKELIGVLKDTLEHGIAKDWDETEVSLRAPYTQLVHSWDKLSKRAMAAKECKEPDVDKGRKELAELLEYIKTSKELKDYFKNRDANDAKRVTTFEYLWTLYPPGTKVVATPFMGVEQLFLVDDYVQIQGNKEPFLEVYCITLGFDTCFHRREIVFKLKSFEDTKPITSLDCYPTKFMENEADFMKLRQEQGKKFKEFCFNLKGSAKLFYYDGTAISSRVGLNMAQTSQHQIEDDNASSATGSPQRSEISSNRRISVRGQVIVDSDAWDRWGPGDEYPDLGETNTCQIDNSAWHSTMLHEYSMHSIATKDFEDRCKKGDLLDDEYALLPPRVLAYVPVKRLFVQLAVKYVKPIDNTNKEEVWKKDLILADEKKHVIRTLVENHAKLADQRVPDIVEGKGNGLVMLLHGPPGVGKSLTAECVARATSKPLFTVGVADIGTNSKTVENRLNKLFSLAAEWDAVLLIDEADVFMEQRGSNEATLERNALVSVLLRVLEYYEGILILTTNRVLSFDVAIQSRIHLAVMFHDLDEKQTKSVIKVHLAKQHQNLSEQERENFAMMAQACSLNGRQIRNVISAAGAMVDRTERKIIRWTDIKAVLEHTKDFQTAINDHSREMRARMEAQKKR